MDNIAEKLEYSYQISENAISTNSVDINALLLSQLHFTTILTEVHYKIHPDVKLNIRVEAPSQGSFIFNQIIEYLPTLNLLASENVDYLANLIEVVGGIIALKRWLGGKKAEKFERNGENITITHNGNANTVNYFIFNLYKDDKIINTALTKAIEAMDKDDTIQGLKIKPSKEEGTFIEKKDFGVLMEGNDYLDGEPSEEIKLVKLLVKKMDVMPKKSDKVKWGFLYEGISPIDATISDPIFISKIKGGLRLGFGDALMVKLRIKLKFSEAYMNFIPSSYEIKEVIEILLKPNPPKQTTIE